MQYNILYMDNALYKFLYYYYTIIMYGTMCIPVTPKSHIITLVPVERCIWAICHDYLGCNLVKCPSKHLILIALFVTFHILCRTLWTCAPLLLSCSSVQKKESNLKTSTCYVAVAHSCGLQSIMEVDRKGLQQHFVETTMKSTFP